MFEKKRNSKALVCATLVFALLLGGLVACEGAPAAEMTPEEAMDALEGSVSFDWDMENVTFTLPADYAPASGWSLHVSGRSAAGGGMSLHYFEGEDWEPGDTGLINLTEQQRADITELALTAFLPDPDAEGGMLERTIDLRTWLPEGEGGETRTGHLLYFEGGWDDLLLTWREEDGTVVNYPLKSRDVPVELLYGEGLTLNGTFKDLSSELDQRSLSLFRLTLEDGAVTALTELEEGAAVPAGNYWPVDGYYHVVSLFGYRIHPITGEPRGHLGIDIEAPAGTPVSAAAGGAVAEVGRDASLGDYVVIAHSDFWRYKYAGLKDITVREGEKVDRGTVLGSLAGEPEGEVLHYEWQGDGGTTHYDPLSKELFDGAYVKPDGTPLTVMDMEVPGW